MRMSVTQTEFDKAVDQVLGRPEYIHLRRGIQDFIEGVKAAIAEWIKGLLGQAFSNMPPAPSMPKNLATVFMIAGLVGFLAIVVFVAAKAGKTFKRRAAVREILGERLEAGTTPDSLRQKAAGFMQAGDYRMAVRYEYIALLLRMHENNLIYLDETKTNDEITSYLEKNEFKPLSVFRNLVGLFNASWYGHKVIPQAACEQWSNDMNLIWNKVNEIEEKSR